MPLAYSLPLAYSWCRLPRAPVEGADRVHELGSRETFGEVPGVTPFVNERQQRGVRLLVSQPPPHRPRDCWVVRLECVDALVVDVSGDLEADALAFGRCRVAAVGAPQRPN